MKKTSKALWFPTIMILILLGVNYFDFNETIFRFGVFAGVLFLYWFLFQILKRKNHSIYHEFQAWSSHDWDKGRFKGSFRFYAIVILLFFLLMSAPDIVHKIFH